MLLLPSIDYNHGKSEKIDGRYDIAVEDRVTFPKTEAMCQREPESILSERGRSH